MTTTCTQCGSGSVMIERVSDGTPTAFTCGNCGYWWEHEPLDGEAVRAGAASHPHGAVAARWHLGLKDG